MSVAQWVGIGMLAMQAADLWLRHRGVIQTQIDWWGVGVWSSIALFMMFGA